MEHGVSLSDICLENRSTFTGQNLEFSVSIIRALRAETGKALSGIGILTGGFHIPRTKLLAAQVTALAGEDLHWLAAYGPHTHPENWFNDRTGRDIILHELRKTVNCILFCDLVERLVDEFADEIGDHENDHRQQDDFAEMPDFTLKRIP